VALPSCYAQETQTTGQQPRIQLSKARQDSLRSKVPLPTGFVNDYAHLFTNGEVASLDSLVRAFEKKTTVQMAVATLTPGTVSDDDFEDFTFVMINTWGVGQKQTNNGILIVLAPDLRRVRIQNGYGIEKYMTDAETKAIIDEVLLPRFREEKYYEGTQEGILAIISKLEKSGL
jgi:uncharacterized protein